MAITTNRIYSSHSLILRTAEEWAGQPLYFVSISGEVIPSFKSKGDGKPTKEQLHTLVKLPIDKIKEPRIIAGNRRYFRAKHWTVYAGLNSIFNEQVAFNSGFAVQNFRLLDYKNITNVVRVAFDIEVRNSFYPNRYQPNYAILYRVGFKLEMLIYFDRYHRPIKTPPKETENKSLEPILQMMMGE